MTMTKVIREEVNRSMWVFFGILNKHRDEFPATKVNVVAVLNYVIAYLRDHLQVSEEDFINVVRAIYKDAKFKKDLGN